jgi:hypothetical protein
VGARTWTLGALAVLLLAACTSSPPSATPARNVEPFAGRVYRLDLPADWVVLGSPVYDQAIDASPAVADWLERLDLLGPNAFRAYEPKPAAGGVRLAVNTVSPWRLYDGAIFRDQRNIEGLPGVSPGSVTSVWVATDQGKGFGYQWIEDLDWGSGTASTRACIGWEISTEFDPVIVVFSYPTGTSPAVDIEGLMASFRVTGNPAWSLPPNVTMPPSPTPYDKEPSTPGPMPTFHAVPDLEALLPDSFEGRPLSRLSQTGEQSGMTPDNPLLASFGKRPADYTSAQAMPDSAPLLLIGVFRLEGISGPQLLAAMLKTVPGAQVSTASLAGRQVTYVRSGAWPVWYWPTGELVYGVAATSEDEAARVFALLH